MPVPPIPPPLEELSHKPFSFYPPILNIEHNEWRLKQSTWSEILVVNTKTGGEVWVPRRYFGEISRIDEPVMIVGLNRELEYKGGAVWPHERRVIELPRAVNAPPMYSPCSEPRPVSGSAIGLESAAESRAGRLIAIVALLGIAALVVVVSLFRGGPTGRVHYEAVMQSDLGLTGRDDYHAVIRKLGHPAQDRWLAETGEMQYRVLVYPQRSLSIILMGVERDHALYIGALDQNGKPVDSVPLPGGGNTYSMLRAVSAALQKRPR